MNDIRFNPPLTEVPVGENGEEGQVKPKASFAKGFSVPKKTLKILGALLILAAIVWLVFLGRGDLSGVFKNGNRPYSAVFLTNGQVYFGKIWKQNSEQIILEQVFYLKDESGTGNGEMSLVKLGQEIHGPTDELFINRSQVVFYENLRDDSKVVESIKNYK